MFKKERKQERKFLIYNAGNITSLTISFFKNPFHKNCKAQNQQTLRSFEEFRLCSGLNNCQSKETQAFHLYYIVTFW